MLNILKRLFRRFGRTTSDGQKKDGMPTGCKSTESNTKTSSPYDVEVKKVRVKKIKIQDE